MSNNDRESIDNSDDTEVVDFETDALVDREDTEQKESTDDTVDTDEDTYEILNVGVFNPRTALFAGVSSLILTWLISRIFVGIFTSSPISLYTASYINFDLTVWVCLVVAAGLATAVASTFWYPFRASSSMREMMYPPSRFFFNYLIVTSNLLLVIILGRDIVAPIVSLLYVIFMLIVFIVFLEVLLGKNWPQIISTLLILVISFNVYTAVDGNNVTAWLVFFIVTCLPWILSTNLSGLTREELINMQDDINTIDIYIQDVDREVLEKHNFEFPYRSAASTTDSNESSEAVFNPPLDGYELSKYVVFYRNFSTFTEVLNRITTKESGPTAATMTLCKLIELPDEKSQLTEEQVVSIRVATDILEAYESLLEEGESTDITRLEEKLEALTVGQNVESTRQDSLNQFHHDLSEVESWVTNRVRRYSTEKRRRELSKRWDDVVRPNYNVASCPLWLKRPVADT